MVRQHLLTSHTHGHTHNDSHESILSGLATQGEHTEDGITSTSSLDREGSSLDQLVHIQAQSQPEEMPHLAHQSPITAQTYEHIHLDLVLQRLEASVVEETDFVGLLQDSSTQLDGTPLKERETSLTCSRSHAHTHTHMHAWTHT